MHTCENNTFPPSFFHNNEVGSTPEVIRVFPYCLIKIEEGEGGAETLGLRELGWNDPSERSKLLFFFREKRFITYLLLFFLNIFGASDPTPYSSYIE